MSANGNPQAHLNRQTGVLDSLLYTEDILATKYKYNGYKVQRPSYREWVSLLPETNPTAGFYGDKSIFTIPLSWDKMGPLTLEWTQGPLTTTGGTYRRFQDWYTLGLIERIELKYGVNQVETVYPEKIYWNVNKYKTNEHKSPILITMHGEESDSFRDGTASVPTYCAIDLPFSFTKSVDRWHEQRQLAREPQIVVYWRKLEEVVQTDGTAPVSVISDLNLKTKAAWFEVAERDMNTLMVETGNGLLKLCEEHFVETTNNSYKIPAGTTGEWSLEIKNTNVPLRFLAFMIRPQANLAQNMLNNQRYESGQLYTGMKRWQIVHAHNEAVTPWVTPQFNLLRESREYFPGTAGYGIHFVTWDDDPVDELNAHGSYNFAALQTPRLVIDFGSTPTAADMAVTLIKSTWQKQQICRGEWTKVFH